MERKLNIIDIIPSNKINIPDLDMDGYSESKMNDFEKRHLQELAEQTRNYDVNEQTVVAENLDPFILYNAVGKWMESARNQLSMANQLFTGEENV